MEKEAREYPYLGRSYVNGAPFVVFFAKKDTGQVVMASDGCGRIRLGMISDKFDEARFEYLPAEVNVKLNND